MSNRLPGLSPHDERTPSAAAADTADAAELRTLLHESREREADSRRAVNFLYSVINQLPVGLTIQSDDGKTLFVNDTAAAFANAAASPTTDAGAASPAGTARSDEGKSVAANQCAAITTEEHVAGPCGEHTLLGIRRPITVGTEPLLVSATLDITARKQAEIELSKRAYFDDLTGLPNRSLIQEHVEHLLATAKPPARFALAFLDIDNFKHINDYYTHAIGDALLVKVAQRISAHIRPSDILARISGDEFLLVINPAESNDELASVVGSLLQQLKEPFLIEGFEILTSASIGLSVYPDHGLTYEMLRRAADTAMYRIKEGAKGGAALFNSDMGRAMTMRMAQEQRLRLAVRDGRFCCAFQPKVDIRSQEVIGVEALIRLRDEDGVIQAPGDFIGLATELGLIDELTYLALGQIIDSLDLIDEAFGPETTVSINIAAKQATDLKFMRALCEELSATSYAGRFMIEVTEDAFLARNLFQRHVLPMLREIGTRVSIDDFGTGYSSLSALADITADELKIDRSFITDIQSRSRSQSILKAIEALSEPLGMTVVAEGVETFEEAAYLQAATRIRFAQGFYFSRPVFMEDLKPRRSAANARAMAAPREKPPLRRYR
jgi:diguanylate cyclase (GGDEF)-like protein